MHSTLKKVVATVAVAGALTVGTAGAAFAADGSSGSTTGGAVAGQSARHPGIRLRVAKAAFKIVLDQLGVSKDELKAALKGGQTISQYATLLGKEQALSDALNQAANDRIDQAVTNGKISAERGASDQDEGGPPGRQVPQPHLGPGPGRPGRPAGPGLTAGGAGSTTPRRPRSGSAAGCPPASRRAPSRVRCRQGEGVFLVATRDRDKLPTSNFVSRSRGPRPSADLRLR